ncbi:MAG TPA: MFS transporter [Gaiellaceae bacterium]|nr:MFS transporter [Gaiellaceae bacterium]
MAYLVLLALGVLDSAGYSIIAPVVPAIGDETGAGPGLIGVLVATFAVGQMVGYPLAARVLARRNATYVLGVSLFLVAVGDIGFVVGGGLAVYFPARFLQGIGAGLLWMGISFAVLERYPGEEYKRLTGTLAAYSVGGILGPAMGAVGGVQGPFLVHMVAVLLVGAALALLPRPTERVRFGSDRSVLRSPGFLLASVGILLVALSLGTFDGPLPLHFSEELDQVAIAALYVGAAVVAGGSAVVAGHLRPRAMLLGGALVLPAAITLAGLSETVAFWILLCCAFGVGIGIGEAGALGTLLESIGTDRIVLAMVVWSQVWAVGYLAGPAVGGGLAEAFGYWALGLVPAAIAVSVLVVAGVTPARARSGASPA